MSPGFDPFEEALAGALRAQPEPAPRRDLAAAAIAIARAHEARIARLAAITRWTRFVTAAAAILILATLITGYFLLPVSETTTDTTSVAVDSSTDTGDTLTSSTGTSTSLDWSTIGLGTLGLAVVGVTLTSLMTTDRPTLQAA